MGYFEGIIGWFETLFESIGNWFTELWTNINNGFTSVIDYFKQRDEEEKQAELEQQEDKNNEGSELINDSVSSITDKFNFIDNIKTNVNDMIEVITDDTKTPKFELTVNSKWYSGKVTVIDFSWYDDYRDLGDNVICCFCYLSFLWHIFKRLPDIIQGAGADSYVVSMGNDIEAYRVTGFGRSSNIRKR